MTPHDFFIQNIWWMLQAIKKDHLLMPENGEFTLSETGENTPELAIQRKLLRMLRGYRAITYEAVPDAPLGRDGKPVIFHITLGDKFHEAYKLFIYKILTEPFYYGYFGVKNEQTGERDLVKGAHTPMITEEEFDLIQIKLGRKGKPRPRTNHHFSYTGKIECGECGSMITAEEKHQLICTKCKNKFAYKGKDTRPQCETKIEAMKKPTILHYVYYHCTKQKNKKCTQKFMRADGGLLTLEEYKPQRKTLLAQKKQLEEAQQDTGRKIEEWISWAENSFNFAAAARTWFENGAPEQKRAVFMSLSGSNLTLKDKTLSVSLKKPLDLYAMIANRFPSTTVSSNLKNTP